MAVNHISYQVADYVKTRDFYADLFGLKVVADTGTQCCLVLNDSNTFIIPRSAPPEITPPRIDHVAYTIAAWDKNAVGAELDRRGLKPRPDSDNSFHVKDPNGFDLQISVMAFYEKVIKVKPEQFRSHSGDDSEENLITFYTASHAAHHRSDSLSATKPMASSGYLRGG